MDKKAKKKIEVLRQRIQKIRLRLAGAKEQNDEPGEIEAFEAEIAAAHAKIDELKRS